MTHIHNLIDFAVAAYIVCDGKVLLAFHKELKMWLPIGGHVELDEDPEEALSREIKEESGLDVEVIGEKSRPEVDGAKPLYAPKYLDIARINDNHKHINLIYFAKSKTVKVTLKTDEHNDIKWFSKEELVNERDRNNIRADIRFYAEEALNTVR